MLPVFITIIFNEGKISDLTYEAKAGLGITAHLTACVLYNQHAMHWSEAQRIHKS